MNVCVVKLIMNSLHRDLISYQHGYCYIYAIALAHVLDKGITLVWDTDAMTDNLEPIGEDCLVHAFVTPDNCNAFDAGGLHKCIESMIAEYPCNEEAREVVSIGRMHRIAKQKGWEEPSQEEIDALILHIKKSLRGTQ